MYIAANRPVFSNDRFTIHPAANGSARQVFQVVKESLPAILVCGCQSVFFGRQPI
jgi:hypothetical protein